MKKYLVKFRAMKSFFCGLLLTILLSVNPLNTLALDAPLQSIDINGTNVYNVFDGYNEGHGISGVSFDEESKVLILTNTVLQRIHASGDLDINLIGENNITATTDNSALLAMGGDLTISGDGASLTISALSAGAPAISIGAGGRLTVGDTDTSITVTVAQGFLVNCEDTFIVDGNILNLPSEEPGPGGPGPEPGDPLQLFIGEELVIDETAVPPVTSADGIGWVIQENDYVGYQLDIDAAEISVLDQIHGVGDGSLGIYVSGGDITIDDNNTTSSIFFEGNVNILFGMGPDVGDFYLTEMLFTQGEVSGGDGNVFIGTPEAKTAVAGVVASSVFLSTGSLTINTNGTGLEYWVLEPEPDEGLFVDVRHNADLLVESSSDATSNAGMVRVLGGGLIELNYTNELGVFESYSGHWPWTEFTGTDMENVDPVLVPCEVGVDSDNYYSMTNDPGNFILESTSKALFQLGYNYDDSSDSQVVNGSVNVIAANGYKFVSGGFHDFSIEEGTEVTIELLPDYGYQYVSGGINGIPTSPEAGKASYSFIMPGNHVHISAIFEEASDIVDIETNKVTSATFTAPESQINGNAELVISNANDEETEGFKSLSGGYEIGTLLDLTLNELILKGTEDEAWRTALGNLDSDTTVSLTLGDDLKGHAQYKVIREHEGAKEVIEVVYDPSTSQLTFDTDAFSTYAIAYNDPANPNTYDGIYSNLMLGITSILGLITIRGKNKK